MSADRLGCANELPWHQLTAPPTAFVVLYCTYVSVNARLRRVDEFVRLQTLLRIEQETERTEKIKAEREYIVEQVCFPLFIKV